MNKNECDPVYILIRTSGRPIFFKKMMESIKNQTWPNIITIVHTDNEDDDYIEGDIIVKGEKSTDKNVGSAPYNLYCNTLLKSIPETDGWFHFMDDDDAYSNNDSIERLVKASRKECVNVARSDRGHGNIWPKYWRGQKSFQTQCFFLHTDHKLKSSWWSKKAGDHHYSKQLTDVMPINWIDGLIVAKAQEGKGRGLRADAGEMQTVPQSNIKTKTIPIYFLKDVKSPAAARGNVGDIKQINSKIALQLANKKLARFIDLDDYNRITGN